MSKRVKQELPWSQLLAKQQLYLDARRKKFEVSSRINSLKCKIEAAQAEKKKRKDNIAWLELEKHVLPILTRAEVSFPEASAASAMWGSRDWKGVKLNWSKEDGGSLPSSGGGSLTRGRGTELTFMCGSNTCKFYFLGLSGLPLNQKEYAPRQMQEFCYTLRDRLRFCRSRESWRKERKSAGECENLHEALLVLHYDLVEASIRAELAARINDAIQYRAGRQTRAMEEYDRLLKSLTSVECLALPSIKEFVELQGVLFGVGDASN